VKLTVLVEDSAKKSGLTAKHELSVLVEITSAGSYSRLLMDAGHRSQQEILLQD
jgi:metal-dependent hydrolase (beta-lactamase superfamily II)